MPLLSEVITQVWEAVAQRTIATQPIGLPTGIPELDAVLGEGWERQQLTYLVGNSGVGKSWLATWTMLHGVRWLADHPGQRPLSGYVLSGSKDRDLQTRIQQKEGKPPLVVFWSLEMAALPIGVRMTAQAIKMVTGEELDSKYLRLGKVNVPPGAPDYEDQRGWLAEGYTILRESWGQHVYIEFQDRTILEFCDTLDELSRYYDVVLVIIDYFRKVNEFESSNATESQERRSADLMDVAKHYDCHILCIFDITRLGQQAKRVGAEHMKHGTGAQFDADIILVMNEHLTAQDEGLPYATHGLIDLTVEKNRLGGLHEIRLRVNRAIGSFESQPKGGN